MNKTKKNGFLKAAGLMLVVMMLATCVLSGTMAKYQSQGSVTDSLTVAKWNVTANGNTNFETGLASLTWTIKDIPDTVTGLEDNHDKKIAPGTWGYAAIEIKNESDSDVDAIVTLSSKTLSPTGDNSDGLNFKVVANKSATLDSYSALTDGAEASDIDTTGVRLAAGESITVYICFEWTYADHETQDTPMGVTAGSIEFGSLTITATQANIAS